MADQLVDMLAEDDFKPEKYTDAYREALQALIDAKLEGREPAVPEPWAAGEAVDLAEALRASVEDARTRRDEDTKRPSRMTPEKAAPQGKRHRRLNQD